MQIEDKSTKDQILKLLKRYGRLSVNELSDQLSITKMAIRRHIHSLEHEKLIQSAIQRQTMGRPSKVYQLSERGEDIFPKKYKELSLSIFKELKEIGQTNIIEDILDKRNKKKLDLYEMPEVMSLIERLVHLKNIQDKEGFMPEITKVNGEYHFQEFNCPLIELAKEHPQFCEAEKNFFHTLLNVPVIKRKACMASGDVSCHYVFK
ncbi:metalloregulator ArsR/SmtB family transcription factor [Bacillus sp. 03113]|uniref:helix-turn-helix transcriptional regulator n=1 Tax=Bacillus sp. 03113 TaxID=2578211 RepID=UPI0011432A78|nr:metalloregulator ArsR/SmtB family transcription factor [Bacillus sp. 03113]